MSETVESVAIDADHKQLAEQLVAQAKDQGVELVGPNGLLNQLTKSALETAPDAGDG
jgi:type III secretion system FlhB-like substrate exporter